MLFLKKKWIDGCRMTNVTVFILHFIRGKKNCFGTIRFSFFFRKWFGMKILVLEKSKNGFENKWFLYVHFFRFSLWKKIGGLSTNKESREALKCPAGIEREQSGGEKFKPERWTNNSWYVKASFGRI